MELGVELKRGRGKEFSPIGVTCRVRRRRDPKTRGRKPYGERSDVRFPLGPNKMIAFQSGHFIFYPEKKKSLHNFRIYVIFVMLL